MWIKVEKWQISLAKLKWKRKGERGRKRSTKILLDAHCKTLVVYIWKFVDVHFTVTCISFYHFLCVYLHYDQRTNVLRTSISFISISNGQTFWKCFHVNCIKWLQFWKIKITSLTTRREKKTTNTCKNRCQNVDEARVKIVRQQNSVHQYNCVCVYVNIDAHRSYVKMSVNMNI